MLWPKWFSNGGDHFGQRTSWSFIYFLNYPYLENWPSVLYFCSPSRLGISLICWPLNTSTTYAIGNANNSRVFLTSSLFDCYVLYLWLPRDLSDHYKNFIYIQWMKKQNGSLGMFYPLGWVILDMEWLLQSLDHHNPILPIMWAYQ